MAWIPVYAHDEHGTPKDGNALDALRASVERGAAVRVAYIPVWTGPKIEYPPYAKLIMDVNPVFSRPGAVLGQARWFSVDIIDPYDALQYPGENTTYILNLSTSGKVYRRTVNAAGLQVDQTEPSNWALEWYCDL